MEEEGGGVAVAVRDESRDPAAQALRADAQHPHAGERPGTLRAEVEERPRGAMLVTALYLVALVSAWAYMYFTFLSRG